MVTKTVQIDDFAEAIYRLVKDLPDFNNVEGDGLSLAVIRHVLEDAGFKYTNKDMVLAIITLVNQDKASIYTCDVIENQDDCIKIRTIICRKQETLKIEEEPQTDDEESKTEIDGFNVMDEEEKKDY